LNNSLYGLQQPDTFMFVMYIIDALFLDHANQGLK
jgi:hypothetical protein